MKKATKWAMGIIAFAILIIVVIWGIMKMVQLEKEQEQAQKKLEEEQKVKEQKEAEKLASEYMVSYAENLQEDMQDVGLLDLKVTYDTCTRDYFDEYWNIWDYGQDEYCVYYVLDYYSDSIDSIYERETKNGDFQSFIKLLNDECCMKDNRDEGGAYYQHKVTENGNTVLVFIGDENRLNNITIKKDNLHQYTLNRDDDDVRVFVNEELVYRKSEDQKKTKTFPIFINYDKQDDISDTTKYEDHFVGDNRLIAISKSGRTIASEDVQNFLHAKERGIDVQLFVRKNKDDKISKEFYYLGRVNATGQVKEFVMPNTDKTAVEIEWILDTPVREDIYEYIVNG